MNLKKCLPAFLLFLNTHFSLGVEPPLIESTKPTQEEGASPSDVIIFAGISGLFPKFIESGPDKGTGWMEYETQEIRKGVQEDGVRLKVEYMTPARIDYEFRRKSAICTWPALWQNPKRHFSQQPDQIFSIPLSLGGDENHSIMLHTEDLPKFQKHLRKNGNLDLDSLLLDPSLKTLLIEGREYKSLKKLFITSPDGSQTLKKEYQKNVEVRVVRESRQLAEMLNARRFDYIFSDAVEDRDFAALRFDKARFTELNYRTSRIENKEDPEFPLVSISCSVNPLTVKAMPYFNKWISFQRGQSWLMSKSSYRKQLEPIEKYLETGGNNSPVWRFGSVFAKGYFDQWYPSQQKYFNGLELYPKEGAEGEFPPIPTARAPVMWNAIELATGELALIQQLDVDLDATQRRGNFADRGNKKLYSRDNIVQYLSSELLSRLKRGLEGKDCRSAPDFKTTVKGLAAPKKITLFAKGLLMQDMEALKPLLQSPGLTDVSVFDGAPEIARAIVSELPNRLEHLNLTHSSLTLASLAERIATMPLKTLHLNDSQLRESQVVKLIEGLPAHLQALSLGYQRTAWDRASSKAFAKRNLRSLRLLDLERNCLVDEDFQIIGEVLPPSLETLRVGGNDVTIYSLNKILKQKLTRLREFDLFASSFIADPKFPVRLPPTLKHLTVAWSLYKVSLDHIVIPTGLTYLDADCGTYSDMSLKSIETLISALHTDVEVLDLSRCDLNNEAIKLLVKRQDIRRIGTLNLSTNRIDDDGIKILNSAKFSVDVLRLEANLIKNRGAILVAERWLPHLKGLSLGQNLISDEGVAALASHLHEGLERLYLPGLLSPNIEALALSLPKSLKRLDLSNNQLSDRDMEILAPRLPKNLEDLYLSSSSFGVRGARQLGLFMPKKLRTLSILKAPITSRGLGLLAPTLPQTLNELALGGFTIQPREAKIFADSLPSLLTKLSFVQSTFDDPTSSIIFSRIPLTLQRLVLQASSLGLEGAKALSHHMPNQIRELWFDGPKMGDQGTLAVVHQLPVSVESIWLNDVGMKNAGLAAIAGHSLENVWRLSLSGNSFTSTGMKALDAKPRRIRNLLLINAGLNDEAISMLGPNTLFNLNDLLIGNDPISGAALVRLFGRLGPRPAGVSIPATQMTYAEVDLVIQAIPKTVKLLVISGSQIGQGGFLKFRKYKDERDKLDPMGFDLKE